MSEEKKPFGDDIFIKDKIIFLGQMKMRSKILNTLRANFNVEELLVISEKREEKENGEEQG